MPALDINILSQLKDDYKNYDTFIETGTYQGETTFAFEPLFKQIYTIEIKREFYEIVKSKYIGNKINFLLGDSSEVFKTLLPTIETPSIFFLDGHWSAGDTGRGLKDCPLFEELQLIHDTFLPNAIIIIDDCRLFGCGPNTSGEICNWEDITITEVVKILGDRIDKTYFLDSSYAKNDRMVVHLKSK